jgi:6-phosphofructokinase 2
LRCIVDSSGDALAAALDVGNIELVKPNQKELSALVQRDLSQPDDVRLAAQELIRSGKVQRVVVSWEHRERLALTPMVAFRSYRRR